MVTYCKNGGGGILSNTHRKGFTLIELLAVIVILAVIALIATPIILNMVENAKKSAAVDSAYGYIDAIEKNNALAEVGSSNYIVIPDGTYNDVTTIDIKVKGQKPTSGNLTIEKGRITSADLCINGYQVKYENNKATSTGKCGSSSSEETKYTVYADGTAVYYNPVTGEKCNESEAVSTTGTTTGCMKFYTFNDSEDSSTVNMILDHNTTALVAWNSTGSNTKMLEIKTALESDTASWKQTARLITANEVAEITGAKETLSWTSDKTYASTPVTGTSISWFYLDGIDGTDGTWHTEIAESQGASKYAWIYDNTYGCTSYGCNISDDNQYEYGTSESTNYISGYWTSTSVVGTSSGAWRVYRSGVLSDGSVDVGSNYGVRPVITISKSIIS